MHFRSTFLTLSVFLSGLFLIRPAGAGVILTFDSLTPGPFTSLTENGYVIDWLGFGDQPDAVDVGGHIALVDSNLGFTNGLLLGSEIGIHRVDGLHFDLPSFEVANIGVTHSGVFTFNAHAFTGVGFLPQQDFSSSSPAFQPFVTDFTGITDGFITTIGVSSNGVPEDNYAIGSIQVDALEQAAPEPSTCCMLAIGTAVVVLARIRSRRSGLAATRGR